MAVGRRRGDILYIYERVRRVGGEVNRKIVSRHVPLKGISVMIVAKGQVDVG